MDTQTYNENLYMLVRKYIEDSKQEVNDFKMELINDGQEDSLSIISKWEYAIPKPTKQELEKLDLTKAKEDQKNKRLSDEISKKTIAVLYTEQINKLKDPTEGSLIYDKSIGLLKIFIDKQWITV
jgi:PIN domain nuclease of toxin-antitoxin system